VRAAAPLLERHEQEQHTEHELQEVDPGRRLTVVVGIGRTGEEQDHGSDDGKPDEPPEDERGAVRAGARRKPGRMR